MRRLVSGFVVGPVFSLASMASALPIGIVDLGDSVLDTNTNFEWLDLAIPAPCSLGEIESGAPGCDFIAEGWMLATVDDVDEFLDNAGLELPGFSDPPNPNGLELIELLGPTNVVIDFENPEFLVTEIWGITSTPGSLSGFVGPYVSYFEAIDPDFHDFLAVDVFDNSFPVFIPEGPGDVVISYWFFRPASVPEPSTLALVTLALGGLVPARRRSP